MTGLHRLWSTRTIVNFWDTNHAKTKPDFGGSPYHEEDWDIYNYIRTTSPFVTTLNLLRSASGSYWTDDGLSVLSANTRHTGTRQRVT
jgi:hypothetical protein